MKDEPLFPRWLWHLLGFVIFFIGAACIYLDHIGKTELAKIVATIFTVGFALIGVIVTIRSNFVLDARRRAAERADKRRRVAGALVGYFKNSLNLQRNDV